MSPKTAAALAEIQEAIADGCTRIIPAYFQRRHGPATVAAAFKVAKAAGIIEPAYIAADRSTVYQPAVTAEQRAALAERAAATVH